MVIFHHLSRIIWPTIFLAQTPFWSFNFLHGSPLSRRIILYNFDFDDELEIIAITAMKQNAWKFESSSRSPHGFVCNRRSIWRNGSYGNNRIFHDYFADPPVFLSNILQRRFRMKCSLFLCIQSEVEAHEPYFVQKSCVGMLDLSSLQKMTGAVVYGAPTNSLDEYFNIRETTVIKGFREFLKAVVAIF